LAHAADKIDSSNDTARDALPSEAGDL